MTATTDEVAVQSEGGAAHRQTDLRYFDVYRQDTATGLRKVQHRELRMPGLLQGTATTQDLSAMVEVEQDRQNPSNQTMSNQTGCCRVLEVTNHRHDKAIHQLLR